MGNSIVPTSRLMKKYIRFLGKSIIVIDPTELKQHRLIAIIPKLNKIRITKHHTTKTHSVEMICSNSEKETEYVIGIQPWYLIEIIKQ